MTPEVWVAARGGGTASAAAAGGAVPLLPRAMGVAGHGDTGGGSINEAVLWQALWHNVQRAITTISAAR